MASESIDSYRDLDVQNKTVLGENPGGAGALGPRGAMLMDGKPGAEEEKPAGAGARGEPGWRSLDGLARVWYIYIWLRTAILFFNQIITSKCGSRPLIIV